MAKPNQTVDNPGGDERQSERGEKQSSVSRLRTRLGSQASRPGGEEILQAKSLWIKSFVIFGLIIAIFTLWFTIFRTQAEDAFQASMKLMDEGKYAQAIDAWDQFLDKFPKDSRARDARIELGKAHIERNTVGGSPDWKTGLEKVQEFIRTNKDDPEYGELREQIRNYGERISKGAAEDAGPSNDRELLKIADDAVNVVSRFSPENKAAPEFTQEFRQLYRTSEKQIDKQETFDAAVLKIGASIKANNTMEALGQRLQLIQQFPDFTDHAKVRELLASTMKTEQGLISSETVNRDAATKERTSAAFAPLSLTFHPRPLADNQTNVESLVFAVAQGCCYGLSPTSGDPAWRRVIGFDTPFFPIEVTTSIPGLLLYNTNYGELTLIDNRTGALVWRQTLNTKTAELISGAPLVHGGQIYLPTQSRNLYKIDLESGRIISRMTFSQQVHSPPVLTPDGENLVVAGDREVFYTLSLSPLECKQVSYVGHAQGSIQAPLSTMGKLLLACENDQPDNSILHVLSLDADKTWLEELITARVEGQVYDSPVLRGNQLLIPSTKERIAAFQVSDNPENKPLIEITRYNDKSSYMGPSYLTTGAGGQFWLASRALRRFTLTTNTIKPDSKEIAVGLSSQPPKIGGKFLYLGRQLAYSDAVIFEQADATRMVSNWRTVLGSRPLGWSHTAGQSALCINETGDFFRITQSDVEKGGFLLSTIDQLRIPDTLNEPLQAAPLGGGQFGVYAGGKAPTFWIINAVGQVIRTVRIEKPLEAEPIVLGKGIILPLPGKLQMVGFSASTRIAREYLSAVRQGEKTKWSQLVTVDDKHLLAVDSRGKLQRIQFQTAPVASLREVTKRSLPKPVDYQMRVHNRKLLLADAGANLQMIDVSTLETASQIKLSAPPSNDLWLIGNKLFVEVGRNQLQCFEVGTEFKQLWSVPLNNASIVGEPLLTGNHLLVALQNGSTLAIDPENGKLINRITLGQHPGLGPQQFGKHLIVPSIDGSLYRIDALLQTEK